MTSSSEKQRRMEAEEIQGSVSGDQPSRPGRRHLAFRKYGSAIMQALRVAGLRTGSIVEHNGRRCIVCSLIDWDGITLVDIETQKCHMKESFWHLAPNKKVELDLGPVKYNPPPGFRSPLIALRRESGEHFSAYRARVRPLLPRIERELTGDEQFTNEYGSFWSTAAADRIAQTLPPEEPPVTTRPEDKPLSREAVLKRDLERQRALMLKRSGFCNGCGSSILCALSIFCTICSRPHLRPATRHCVLCNTLMTWLKPAQKSKTYLCHVCHPESIAAPPPAPEATDS